MTAKSGAVPYVEECSANTLAVKPRHPDVLKELRRIHKAMHAGNAYGFEQSLLCDLIREIERLRALVAK